MWFFYYREERWLLWKVISETEMIRYAEQYVFHRDVDYEDK